MSRADDSGRAAGARWIAGALAMALAGSGGATAATASDVDDPCRVPAAIRRSPPAGGPDPTEVAVGIVIVDLINVDDAEQMFRANVVMTLRWRDPRLAASARGGSLEECELARDDVWQPDLRSLNRRKLSRLFDPAISVTSDGMVRYEEHVLGEFSSRLDLRQFPFDRQDLRIELVSFTNGPAGVRFVADQQDRAPERAFSLAGWQVLRTFTDVDVPPARVDAENFSRLDHVVIVQRRASYYLWNFVLPLIFIVLMGWSVFWLDPKSAGPQIGVSTASAFTLVAFLISLRTRLPPVPYLTRLDQFALFSTLLVFAAVGQAIFTSRLSDAGKHGLAQRIDVYGRWTYLATFLVVLLVTVVR